jgi:hypothetical protein
VPVQAPTEAPVEVLEAPPVVSPSEAPVESPVEAPVEFVDFPAVCMDDPDFKFKGKKFSCKKVRKFKKKANKQKKWKKLCKKKDNRIHNVFQKKMPVSYYCPVACNACDEQE